MNMALRNKFAQQYASTYVETSVSEATPHKLVAMLYEGALKNLNLAKFFIEKQDFAKKSEHTNKALAIINSLRAGVDLEKGGDVAGNLYDLYDYCYRRVFEGASKNDAEIVQEIIGLINDVQASWAQMPDNVKYASKDQIEKINS